MSRWDLHSGRGPGTVGARDEGGAPAELPGRIDRRKFLRGALLGTGALAGATLAACGGAGNGPRAAGVRPRGGPGGPPVSVTSLPSGVRVPTAKWVIEENAKPGTINWVVTGIQTPHALEGFASDVSAQRGEDVALFVNTSASSFHVEAYRMGYYQGLGGRLIARTDSVAAKPQPPSTFTPGTNLVECPWSESTTITVGRDWPPGCYLLKLVGDGGQQQYIPLCVRDDTSKAAFVLQNSVTTWQAYNLWGEYSLYYGATPSGGSDYANRSRTVSFDRPYPQTWAQGCADFLGNEFPVLFQMEQLGLDMTYWTDVDLHVRPQLLTNHQCLLSLGHDEYWSRPMRDGATQALAKGTNLAFLGANACYRQIRMDSSSVGPNRLQICYKDASEDPLNGSNDALVTVNWEQAPVNDPESTMIGAMYQSVGADADLVITDASHWLLDGCGLSDGQHLPGVVQGEFDRYVPSFPGPTNVDVIGHSPITNISEENWSDITYYSVPNGGGVLASGNATFIGKLSDTTKFPTNVVPPPTPGVTDVLLRAMENLYSVFGLGPAAKTHPSTSNWSETYPNGTGEQTAAGTNAA